MNADKSTAALDVALKDRALFVVFERLVVRVRKDQRRIVLQIRVGEDLGVVSRVDRKAVFLPELRDHRDTGCDIVVDVALAILGEVPGVDEDAMRRLGHRHAAGRYEKQAEEEKPVHGVGLGGFDGRGLRGRWRVRPGLAQ